jgi:hypothetical protein
VVILIETLTAKFIERKDMNKYKIRSKFILSVIIPTFAIWLSFAGAVTAGQRVVVSLPDTVWQSEHSGDEWDTVTIQGTKLVSTGNGLFLSGATSAPPRKWLINLASDTIAFGTGDGSNLFGLRIGGGSSTRSPRNIIVKGGYIIHSPSSHTDTTIANNLCIRLGGNAIKLENVNAVAGGYNGKCLTGAGYDLEISGGSYSSNVVSYRSRCLFDALIIGFELPFDAAFAADSGYSYNAQVHNVKMLNIPHVGIRMDGGADAQYGIYKVYACSILVDARNDRYSSYSGTCYSSSNPYGIALQRIGPGSEIYDNTVLSGTTHGGGRGILIETALGTPDNYVKVYNNYIDIHEGPNAEYDETHMETHSLRLRNDCQYLHVYNNTVIGTGDADTGTPSYGRAIAALRYTFEGAYGGVYSHNIIENNIFRVKSLTSGVTAYAVCFDAVLLPDTTFISRNNRIESDNVGVKYGDVNNGAKSIRLYGDTINLYTPSYSPKTFVVGHLCNNWDCTGNLAANCVYEGAASDDDINFSCLTSATLELGLQRTISIKVNGSNGLPVTGASVWCINAYGDTAFSGTTDGSGYANGLATYRWEANRSADSTAYNNFTLKTKKGNDSASVLHTVSATSTAPTLILSNTSGEVNNDTTAPSRINNLGALPGTNAGEVILSWTAPGDDSATGRASQYDVRYSASTITSLNWNSAALVSGEPTPKTSGGSETFLVTGLQSSTSYYFAMKAADEIPNLSQLSNVVAITTPDKLAPGPISDLQAASGFNAGEIVLSWTAPGDDGSVGTADSYEIRYSISTINESNWNTASAYDNTIPAPLAAGQAQSLLMTGLYPGRTYFLAIKTSDEANNKSAISNIATAMAQSGISQGDDIIVAGLSPDSGDIVYSSRPTFKVENIDTVSANLYYFEIATDTIFMSPIVSSPAVPQNQSGATAWQTDTKLIPKTIYYWRARANDYSFSPGISFEVVIEPHLYPNPFKPNTDGNATFAEIPANSDLVIMSVSGSTIRRWIASNSDDIQWDGTNESGNPVSSGAYLWFIEGTDIKGKLILIR